MLGNFQHPPGAEARSFIASRFSGDYFHVCLRHFAGVAADAAALRAFRVFEVTLRVLPGLAGMLALSVVGSCVAVVRVLGELPC
jgi:hypothetical protein